MFLSDTDRRLVYEVAKVWVDGGGDDLGIDFCHRAIKAAVADIIKERELEEEWEAEKLRDT